MNRPQIYLDHAATTPLLPQARAAMEHGFAIWANPSSPHSAGRAARAALEDARERIKTALDWQGEVIFTSGASEALAIAWHQSQTIRRYASAAEHAAVSRHAATPPLPINALGQIDPANLSPADLIAIQQVNNETGVIQPLAALAQAIRASGALWLCDAAQGAGKLPLPDADMIAIAGHKIGAPIGIGALLVRSLGQIAPTGGQERGYRAGTENLPHILALAAALEADRAWLLNAAVLRSRFEDAIRALGGEVIGEGAPRVATIGAYRLPGQNATAVLIRADMAGIAISSGAACSSGSLKPSPTIQAMGYSEAETREAFRVSIGRETTWDHLAALLAVLHK